MKAILKGGKTIIELYEADKRALAKAEEILHFVGRNHDSETVASAVKMAREGIADVLRELSETPEVDTPKGDVKPSDAKTVAA